MIKFKTLTLMVTFGISLAVDSHAESSLPVTSVSSGILDAIIATEDSVVFNGLKFKYKIDEKQSVLSIDESEPTPLSLKELQVGQMYFFDKVAFINKDAEPKASDFKTIIYITDKKPEGFE